jgi:hypothetical protein
MDYRYACDRCGEIHISNPQRCRNCGSTVLAPIPTKKLKQQSTGTNAPDSIDPDKIGTVSKSKPDVEYDSSPDVAVDGSIKTEDQQNKREYTNPSRSTRIIVLVTAFLLILSLIIFLVL